MLGRLYQGQICSAARTLEIVGERWSLLIIRNAMFAGMTRFTDFQRSLGVAPNILTKRLAEFVEAGIFELRPGGVGGHAEYVLTRKGLDLKPVVVALTEWGDRWAAPDGRPVTYEHEGCGGRVALRMECTRCGERPPVAGVRARFARRFREMRYGWTGQDG
jgi:DNA-binding HxlR family transcriptional regulator